MVIQRAAVSIELDPDLAEFSSEIRISLFNWRQVSALIKLRCQHDAAALFGGLDRACRVTSRAVRGHSLAQQAGMSGEAVFLIRPAAIPRSYRRQQADRQIKHAERCLVIAELVR